MIKSVTRNGRSIFLTAILAIFLVYFFSIIGFLFLKDDFRMEVERLPGQSQTSLLFFRSIKNIKLPSFKILLFNLLRCGDQQVPGIEIKTGKTIFFNLYLTRQFPLRSQMSLKERPRPEGSLNMHVLVGGHRSTRRKHVNTRRIRKLCTERHQAQTGS